MASDDNRTEVASVGETESGQRSRLDVSERGDRQALCQFLARQGRLTLYHQPEWDAVFATYGLSVLRLAAWRGDRLVGILPVVRQKSLLFGDHLVSLPWFDSAGVLAEDLTAEQALLDAVQALATRLGSAQIHIRQSALLSAWSDPRTDKQLLRLELPGTADQLWSGFAPKVRNQVRKAENSGLEYFNGGAELLDPFFHVYSTNMRDLGSPSHGRRFFENVLREFGAQARLHVVRRGGAVIGGGLTLDGGDHQVIPWASSLRKFNSYCVNHLLYWNILREACGRGIGEFHFGRSTVDSGTYHFKKQWGARPETLYWYTRDGRGYPVDSQQHPEERFSLARKTWQHLPLPAARWLGPRVIARVA